MEILNEYVDKFVIVESTITFSGKEKKLFDRWTLLGTTILHKKEWLELFKILKYKGDYYFTTAKSLNLC